MSADDTVTAGDAAWAQIRDHGRKNFDDWIAVARALAIGRSAALKTACTNRPLGSRYNFAMGIWLRDNGLGGINNQERYRACLILENLPAISPWREGLDEAQRRRLNHPGAVWTHWRRQKTDSDRSAPVARNFVKGAMPSHKNGRPIHWPQDVLRRAATALRECRSNDIFVFARAVLEAAIRGEANLVELLRRDAAVMSALPRRADIVSGAGHVR